MRTTELVRRITKAAHAGTPRKNCEVARESAEHALLRCGTTTFTLPSDVETNPYTARAVMAYLARELGEQWWD